MKRSRRRLAVALAAFGITAWLGSALLLLNRARNPVRGALVGPDDELRDAVAAVPSGSASTGLLPGSARAGLRPTSAAPGAAFESLTNLYGAATRGVKPPAGSPKIQDSPSEAVEEPDHDARAWPVPPRAGDGRLLVPLAPELEGLERIAPPEALAGSAACASASAHWHAAGRTAYYHDGSRWGRWDGRTWLWFERVGSTWWAWGLDGKRPFLWHAKKWWWRAPGTWLMLRQATLSREVWFVLHSLHEAGREPGAPARVVYAADSGRVAVELPEAGAWLYDATTGENLGRWTSASSALASR